MAQNVNDNFYVKGGILLEAKEGPWNSIEQFKQFVAADDWAEGLNVYIRNHNKLDHWRFEGGNQEEHLRLISTIPVVLSIATVALRDEIPANLRLWGVLVAVYNDGNHSGHYYLKFGKASEDLADNGNWEKFEGGGGGGSAPIAPVQITYYENGLVKRTLTTYPDSKWKDARAEYNANGELTKSEVQDTLSNQFKRIVLTWVNGQVTETTVTTITEFSITI